MSEVAVVDGHDQSLVDTEKLVTMKINNQMFGIPILQVQDIVEPRMITPVPLAPSAIAGVMNLRGRIVTVINLRRCLGLDDRLGQERCMSITVEYNGDLYTMLVDEIGDVCDLPRRDFESPPATLDEKLRQLCTGIFRLKDDLLVVLDVDRMLDSEVLMKSPPVVLKQRSAATARKKSPAADEPDAQDATGEADGGKVVAFPKAGSAEGTEETKNTPPAKAQAASLFDRIGGDDTVQAATDIYYNKVMADPRLSPFFDGVDMDKQTFMMRVFLTGAFGGPQAYSGQMMQAVHEQLVGDAGLTESHYAAFAEHLAAALGELDIAGDLVGEVMAIVGDLRSDILTA